VVATFIVMPLTYSITNGIGAGFVVHTAIRAFQRKRDSWIVYFATAAFAVYFLRDALGT
jgi:AGZA family xanthine/uracil permease-like MFS transporter